MVSILHVLIQQILIVSIIGGVIAFCAHFLYKVLNILNFYELLRLFFLNFLGIQLIFLPGLLFSILFDIFTS